MLEGTSKAYLGPHYAFGYPPILQMRELRASEVTECSHALQCQGNGEGQQYSIPNPVDLEWVACLHVRLMKDLKIFPSHSPWLEKDFCLLTGMRYAAEAQSR